MTSLDSALRAARQDPAYQNDFYNLFLNSQLIVPIRESSGVGSSPARTKGGESFVPVILQVEGKKYLPVFDTAERLQAWAKREIRFLAIPAHALLESLDSSIHWILNLGTDYFKEFVSDEIKWLKERIRSAAPQPETLSKGSEVRFRRPAKVRSKLLKGLHLIFERNPEVSAAHLAEILVEKPGEKPHLLLVIRLEPFSGAALQAIAREVGILTKGALGPSEYLDILPFTGNSVDAEIVKTIPAFYAR